MRGYVTVMPEFRIEVPVSFMVIYMSGLGNFNRAWESLVRVQSTVEVESLAILTGLNYSDAK